jgi:hypothetical protein
MAATTSAVEGRDAHPSTVAADGGNVSRTAGLWAIWTVSLLSIGAYVATAVQRIGYPYELQFFEGSTVEVSARVTEGLPLYGPPSTAWTPWPYPPLYFWITGQVGRITGINLPTLRSVSFAASLVALLLLVLIVRRTTSSATAGIVAAGLFAGTYRVTGAWFDAARVDSLLVMLLLLALYVAQRSHRARGGLLVGVVLVLAFLTKQNALIVAVPILAWLLVRRRPAGVAAAVVVVAGSVGSVLVGDAVTGGWYSPYVVSQLLGHGVVARWLLEFWLVDVALPFALVLLAVTWWGWSTFGVRGRDVTPTVLRRWSGSDAGLVGAAVVGLLMAGLAGRLHDGGYVNVAIPAHVAVSLLLGLVAGAALRDRRTTRRLLIGVAVVVGAQVIVMSQWHTDVVPSAADRAGGDAFISELRRLPGTVLVPSHPFYLRLAGRAPHASGIAIGDLMATRPNPAREAMAAALPWSLDGVGAVVLDAPADTALFGPTLERDFTLVTSNVVPGDSFVPPTDVETKPSLLYIRTTELPR